MSACKTNVFVLKYFNNVETTDIVRDEQGWKYYYLRNGVKIRLSDELS